MSLTHLKQNRKKGINMNDCIERICEVLEETSNCTVKVGADLFYVCCREYLNYNENLLNKTLKDFNVKFTCFEVSFHQEDIEEVLGDAESYKMMYKFSFEKIKEEGVKW